MEKFFNQQVSAATTKKRRGEVLRPLPEDQKKHKRLTMKVERENATEAEKEKHLENARAHYYRQKAYFEALDKKDANRANFVSVFHPDQSDVLKAEYNKLVNDNWTIQINGKRHHFPKDMLVEKLKKDPRFSDKSYMKLWNTLRHSSAWLKSTHYFYWHPEQDDYMRTCILFYEDAGRVMNNKKVTLRQLAKDLSKNPLLRDKKVEWIFKRLENRNACL